MLPIRTKRHVGYMDFYWLVDSLQVESRFQQKEQLAPIERDGETIQQRTTDFYDGMVINHKRRGKAPARRPYEQVLQIPIVYYNQVGL